MKQKLLVNLVEDYLNKLLDQGCTDLFEDDPLLSGLEDKQQVIDEFEGSAVSLVDSILDSVTTEDK